MIVFDHEVRATRCSSTSSVHTHHLSTYRTFKRINNDIVSHQNGNFKLMLGPPSHAELATAKVHSIDATMQLATFPSKTIEVSTF